MFMSEIDDLDIPYTDTDTKLNTSCALYRLFLATVQCKQEININVQEIMDT